MARYLESVLVLSSGPKRTKTGNIANIDGQTSSGKHHLQRIVDVGKVRTLIWCRKCAGWTTASTSERRLGKSMWAKGSEGGLPT